MKGKEDAKLKKTMDDNSITLEIIPKYDEFEILEDQGDWYRVNYKKIKGYVKKDQIEVIEQETSNEEDSEESNLTNEQSQNTNEEEQNQNTVNEIAKENEALVFLDTSMKYLLPSLEAHPDIVKITSADLAKLNHIDARLSEEEIASMDVILSVRIVKCYVCLMKTRGFI